MAYFICHGRWLNLMYLICIMGFICCTLIKLGSALEGGINYTLRVSIYVIGGQGGDINELCDTWA